MSGTTAREDVFLSVKSHFNSFWCVNIKQKPNVAQFRYHAKLLLMQSIVENINQEWRFLSKELLACFDFLSASSLWKHSNRHNYAFLIDITSNSNELTLLVC